MAKRLLSASVIIAILLGVIYLDLKEPLADVPGLWLVPVFFLLSLLAAGEMITLLKEGARGSVHFG